MTDQLSRTFAALADPTRRAMLAQLVEGEATVNELAAPHAVSLPTISRHLKVLETAGLVHKGRAAQWRPCRLEAAQLRVVDEWIEPYRRFFAVRIDRLEEQLRREQAPQVEQAQQAEQAAQAAGVQPNESKER